VATRNRRERFWGAIEKSTGEEFFINEVVKFLEIFNARSLDFRREFEFNFGLIVISVSHSCSPVAYCGKQIKIGSVSCVVGRLGPSLHTDCGRVKLGEKDKSLFLEDQCLLV